MSVVRVVATLNLVLVSAYPTCGDEALLLTKSIAEPHSDEASDIESGRGMFRTWCAACHGVDAKGGRAPDLTAAKLRHGTTRTELYKNIQLGIPGAL